MTPSGTSLATFVAIPTLCDTSATISTSLYASGDSSIRPFLVKDLTYIPLDSNFFLTLSRVLVLFASDLDMVLPAPWAVDPKLRSIDFVEPKRTQLAVPIDPGI